MKKLSLIVAMAVILTIGGVFAAWTYYEEGYTISNNPGVTVVFDDNAGTETKGTISFAPGDISFTITQEGTGYTTGWTHAGSSAITFTPNGSNTSATLVATVTVSGGTYNGNKFLAAKAANTFEFTVTKDVPATITSAQIAGCLDMSPVTLATKAEYEAFAIDATATTITVTVAEKPAP